MLTGYDHLLFLLGAMFLLPRALDVLKFATAFTIGHTITLLGATRIGIRIDHHVIDAVIALTVIGIGAWNLRRSGAALPWFIGLTFVAGLVHGFGLSTAIQDMTLRGDQALMSKLLAFNVGVEGGQIVALAVYAAVLALWRTGPAWLSLKRLTNGAVVLAGVALLAVQVNGLIQTRRMTTVAAINGGYAP